MEEAIDRDALTLCRQDAQLITHADSIERYKLMQQKKLTRTDPAALLELEKKKKEAAKFVKSYTNAEKKRQEKLEKDRLKAADKLRFQSLTPAQKKQETAQKTRANQLKKQETQRKKREKDAATQREFEHAQNLLGEAAVIAIQQSALSNQHGNVAVHSQTEQPTNTREEEESSDEEEDQSEEEEEEDDADD
jgi:hypothetical protein